MRKNYKKLGPYIQEVNIRNKDLKVELLLGVSIKKVLMPSIANTVGTKMHTYKIIQKHQFAYGPVTSRNGDKISIALLEEHDEAIVSQAYTVFEVKDKNELDPEYLMMWFRRPEFDRYARYHSHGSARETFDWDSFCETELPIPTVQKQREIVAEYNTVQNRIQLNEQLIQKLEETAQTIYRRWFVEFEFPIDKELAIEMGDAGLEGKPYKSSGGEMVWSEEMEKDVPEGWEVKKLKNIASKIGSGSTPRGGKESYKSTGVSLIRSMNVFDFKFKNDELAFIDNQQADKLIGVTVKSGDVLFNITGASVARCCIVPDYILPARVNQHVSIIRLRSNYKYYLLCTLCYSDTKRKLVGVSESGSTREAITKDDLETFSIIIPKPNLSKMFESYVDSLFNHKSNLELEFIKLSEHKELLLSKMTKVKETEEKEIINN